jgi:NAD+ synthase (glutamine-hydrolysing)
MKIALAQLDFIIGDFAGNTAGIIRAIKKAEEKGAELICFSELCISGYPPRDFLEFTDFITRCQRSVEEILPYSQNIGVLIGVPIVNPVVEGKDLFNAALLLYEGKVMHTQHKSLLPTYDIFDEYRYFEPGKTFQVATFKGKKIAITICEDIWNIGNENPLYTVCPLDEMQHQQPDFIVNLSASPFSYEQAVKRLEVVRANSLRYKLPVFYANQTGAQTEILFDGGSIVMCPDGTLYDEMPYFQEEIRIFDLDDVLHHRNGRGESDKNKTRLIHEALVCGIKGYFSKLGLSKAILGLSGGIDSAVTAALSVAALGLENVRGVLMPGPFSSDHSVEDAKILAENLGIRYDIIAIESVYKSYLNLLLDIFEGKPFDVTEENIQSRIRGMILMALSNKFGYIVLNTSNKSEAAVGYGTLYGDMCGGLSVLGDVYKMEVYDLAHYINRSEIIIPENSILKPPSAELRHDQKDSDSLPEYELLDQILYAYIEGQKGPREIMSMGFDETVVRRVLKMVNSNEFKRYQTPPVLRVSPKAFGMGRRMPIVGKYLS